MEWGVDTSIGALHVIASVELRICRQTLRDDSRRKYRSKWKLLRGVCRIRDLLVNKPCTNRKLVVEKMQGLKD